MTGFLCSLGGINAEVAAGFVCKHFFIVKYPGALFFLSKENIYKFAYL